MESRYTTCFDTLVALITHLSATHHKSRTPKHIAADLALDHDEVGKVLDMFPAFFRRSRTTSEHGEHFYTVHLRYARRKQGEDEGRAPLDAQELSALIDLVTHMVAQEQETSRLFLDLKQRYRNLLWTNLATMASAIIAALVAIYTAMR